MNNKNGKEFICPAQAIGVFTTRQINQQKIPGLLDLILNYHQLIPQPLLNNIGGGFICTRSGFAGKILLRLNKADSPPSAWEFNFF